MTAHSGDPYSGDMIFPPFVPRSAPAAPPAPPAAPAPAPPPEPQLEAARAPVEEAEPWADLEAAASGIADGAQPAAEAAEEAGEDLPWLELPVTAASGSGSASGSAVDDSVADEPAVPDWMSWDPGAPAAAVTETPEIPPAGDVDASAAAREAAEGVGAPMPGLESFDRDETADVAPVDGLAPVGDFDAPIAAATLPDPPAAYETPEWAQPAEAWAAPPEDGEDPLLATPDPLPLADVLAGVEPDDDGAADEPEATALDAEVAALLDAPAPGGVETAAPAVEAETVASAGPSAVDPAMHGGDHVAAALGDVAGRLEAIARSLRERSPAEVLAGRRDSTDRLELLVTGFVLGYLQGGGER